MINDCKFGNEIHERIKQTEAWIDEILKDSPAVPILDSLPGFGKILSALAVLEIDDINRFSTKAKFSSYCGLIPCTFASGEKVYHGHLPAGNSNP